MQILEALLLGIIQGFTEFIPVSSSAHLLIFGKWLNFEASTLSFDLALHIGTLVALFLFFRGDLYDLGIGLVKKTEHSRMSWMIVLATIPAVIGGVLLQSYAQGLFRSDAFTVVVATNLITVAVIMLAAERLGAKKYELKDTTIPKILAVGLAQVLALVPGVSRSGITISAGLLAGFNHVAATRLSFLLSFPVILGAVLKVVFEPSGLTDMAAAPALYIAGAVGAAVSGYAAIKFMLKYLATRGLGLFAYYRIALGIIILLVGV
ncbi:MAG TPA: undecaprenyl-diphosphate phosphatase [Candidatus Dormibacteraeota bacterium]|nr:undecaprenyl-diphosphate phosphatase [Candidatus Dormibacteraeota bacterium]